VAGQLAGVAAAERAGVAGGPLRERGLAGRGAVGIGEAVGGRPDPPGWTGPPMITSPTPAPGPPGSTTTPSPAAKTTRTPPASSPGPGCTSSGTAGRTIPPTAPHSTRPSSASSPKKHQRQLDTGLLTRPACWSWRA